MKIPTITSLICECWKEAEESVRELIATRYLDEDEEFITKLFHGEFYVVVNETSQKGRVGEAFRKDVTGHFPNYDIPEKWIVSPVELEPQRLFTLGKLKQKPEAIMENM